MGASVRGAIVSLKSRCGASSLRGAQSAPGRKTVVSASSPENTDRLGAINHKIVADGESLPVVRLQDGSAVQTGTVAAMLHNVERYNRGERGQIEDELRLAVPTLVKVGLFALFPPQDWIAADNPGRSFVGRAAAQYLAEKTAEGRLSQ